MKLGFCVSGGGRVVEAIFVARKAGLLNLKLGEVVLDKQTSFTKIADAHAIPFTIVLRKESEDREAYRKRLGEAVSAMAVDALFLTFNWLLPPTVVQKMAPNLINMHMGILPFLPGSKAVTSALDSGMTFGGVTFHLVDEGMDTGPIVSQTITSISSGMTKDVLGRALFKTAVPMAIQNMRWLEQGRLGRISCNRVHVDGARFDQKEFSPAIDDDIYRFGLDYMAERYPD